MSSHPLIADHGEFVDVLGQLRRGRLLVTSDRDPGRGLIEGGWVYHAHATLASHGLLEELPLRPEDRLDAPHLHWWRLSPGGRDFAERAWAEWKARPWWQRCWLRLTG